ncbi:MULTISPECIES: FkbM family methyltransferase [Roseomonadaceae]|uniref:FkbM family methyltransferase n=1 Tax=Falsiroseomonas oleicola TaxID=2801474 RepID=A0ABS6H2C9_9PROT|nr:FkbM family methyltransferase [Roseomonas oleicola]MBU8542822.1 FkbM family methyltransferase [Roseomonas oleicola]
MRRMILDTLRRATGTQQLRQSVTLLEEEVARAMRPQAPAALPHQAELARLARHADFPLQSWWERSLWEPVVQLAVRDHVRPGDIAFDVGANAGAFAMQMSRQAGPRGIVCAFEASPRIIGRTHHNLTAAGCHNVTLYHRAIWNRSGDFVHIAEGSHLNDRVEQGAGGIPVPTLALDDFIAATGLSPSFIKMDIEGAELDALRGSARLIAEGRPIMALEQAPDDMRCHELLIAAGYLAVDLGSYKRITRGEDFSNPTGVNNVLFVPEEKTAASPYFDPRQERVAKLEAGAFTRDAAGGARLAQPMELPAGRYLVRADFAASGRDNEVYAGVEADGETVFRYHTFTAFMAECYRDWVVQLDRPGRITPFLRFLNGSDATLDWRGAEVLRLPAFDGVAPPLVF